MPNFKKFDDKKFQRHIIKIISIPVALIFLLLIYSHFQIKYINSINDQVEKIDKTILETVRFEKIVSDMGAGFRGYLLTGQIGFLDPYKDSIKNVEVYKEKIFVLLNGKYVESKTFRDTLQVFQTWKELTINIIAMRSQANEQAIEKSTMLATQANEEYTQIRESLSRFERAIGKLKDKKVKELERSKQTSNIFEAVYIIALIITLIVLLSREAKSATRSYNTVLSENDKILSDLQESSTAKDLFLANMSHEIRTPLGAVLGFCELALEDKSLSEQSKKYLDFIKRNSDHLLILVNDLFDISKIAAEKIELSNNSITTDSFINDIKTTFQHKLEEKKISLVINKQGVLPEEFVSDQTRLKQIITNLIGNAIKFSPKKSIITMELSHKEEVLIVDIKDNGIGINKENHADIFDSFTQENNTYSRDYGGAGLGLAISKKLAVLLGGDLRLVNSRKNKGSHFQLEVSAPAIQVIEQVSQSSTEDSEINLTKEELAAKPTIKSLNNTLTGKKILLAEDSKENQILFKIFIESTGALLTIVSNGEDAVHELENGDYDLGILDIQMPVLDGHNAVSQVRSLGIKLPIFALTAHTLKGEKEKSLKHGFDDFLTKPVKKEELIKTIKKHIFKC